MMFSRLTQGTASVLVSGLVSLATFQMALGAPATPLDVPTPPGQADNAKQQTVSVGDSSVSTQTGAMQYSYPISVPPGRGMTPSVSLDYSSQASVYGGLAVGWTLSAGAFIEVDTSDGREYAMSRSTTPPAPNYRSSLAGGARLIPVHEFPTSAVPNTYRALGDTSYSRYRKVDSWSHAWEVLADGIVYQFGHYDHIEGAAPRTRWPLTRQIDSFGNRIDYYWYGDSSLAIKSIVYSSNSNAGPPHARIDFEYAPSTGLSTSDCSEMLVPVGARLDASHGYLYTPGARKLQKIETFAVETTGTQLRSVRTIELRYMDGTLDAPLNSEVCDEKHGPQRLLWQIRDSGRAADGTITALPPVTFGYGPLERHLDRGVWLDRPGLAADEPENALVWGKRFDSPWRWPTVEAMLLDVDGDGFQDRLVMGDRVRCTALLQRGGPSGFSEATQEIPLPWLASTGQGQPNVQYEDCSLAGRLSFFRNKANPDPGFSPIGSYLAYRFLSLVGNDDLPDIVAALHYDAKYVSTSSDESLAAMGLPAVKCDPPGDTMCPLVDEQCLHELVSCTMTGASQICTVDKTSQPLCLANPELVPCGALFSGSPGDEEPETGPNDGAGAGDGDPEPTDDEKCEADPNCTLIDCEETPWECWPDPMTEPPSTGGGTISITPTAQENTDHSRQRLPLKRCNRYVWYVYENLGGGRFATTPRVVTSPIPLETSDGSSTVGTGPTGYTSSQHGVMDLNGDGHLDVFTSNHEVLTTGDEEDPTASAWYVFFGDGNGGFRGDPGTGHAYIWLVPSMASPGKSLQGFGFRFFSDKPLRLSFQQSGLIDVNGDGLPDFVRRRRPNGADLEAPLQTEVFLNSGSDFFPSTIDTLSTAYTLPLWLSLEPAHGQLATTEITLQNVYQFTSKYIADAYGQSTAGMVDRDGDGLVDFFFPLIDEPGGHGAPATYLPYQAFNGGGRLLSTIHNLTDGITTSLPAWEDPMMERVVFDEGRWWVSSRFTDVTGDGRPDVVDMQREGGAGPYRMSVTTDDGSAMRLMTSINNGRGATVDVTYAPHTDSTAVTQHPEAGFSTPHPLWVATSLRSRDQWSGIDSTTRYHYIDPVTTTDDLGRHGFRGFREVTTRNPSDSVVTTQYGYDVDPTGRLTGSNTYASTADYDAGRPQSVARTHWLGFELYSDVHSYHPDAETSWLCSTGQTLAQCVNAGSQRSKITTWSVRLDASMQSRLIAATRVADYAGRVPWISGAPDMAAYQYDPADRAVDREYVLRSTATEYRLLETASQLVKLPGEGRVARTTTDYDSTGRLPIRTHVWQEGETWATTSAGYDPTTGMEIWSQAAEAYADPEKRAEHGDTPCGPSGPPSKPVMCTSYDQHRLFPAIVRNPLGHQVSSTYDYATGQPIDIIGPNTGQQSRTTYDGLGRPLEVFGTGRPGQEWSLTLLGRTTYVDATSAPSRVTTETRRSWAGDMTRVMVEADGSGRPLRQVSYLAADGLPDAVETYAYFPNSGKLRAFTVPDPSALPTSSASVTYTFEYDGLERPTLALRPAPAASGPWVGAASGVVTTYDGPTTTTRECVLISGACRYDLAAGEAPAATVLATKEMTTDAFGRLVEVAEQTDVGEWAITRYGYNARDEMELLIDAEGHFTELAHDGAGNRREIRRAGRTWEYQYDLDGRLYARIEPIPAGGDPLDYRTTIAYDELGRVTSHRPASRDLTAQEQAEFGTFLVRSVYDSVPFGIGSIGRQETYGSDTGMPLLLWSDYKYDLRGNVTEETRGFDLTASGGPYADTRTITRQYDPLGNEVETSYPDSPQLADRTRIVRTYDSRGLPKDAVRCGSSSSCFHHVVGIMRNSAGRPVSASSNIGNTHAVRYTYDRLGRVRDQAVVYGFSGSSQLRARQTFIYGATDEVAQLTSVIYGRAPRTATFDYDQRHQLIEASDDRGFSGHYEYGTAGRLTAVTVAAGTISPDAHPRDVDYAYDSEDPEAVTRLVVPPLAGGGSVAEYVYDASGNVILRSECQNLAGTCNEYSTTTFRYDGDVRQRSATNADGITEIYFYDPAGQRVLSVQKDTATGAYQQARYWFGETELWYDAAGAESKVWVHVSHGGPAARIENRTQVEFTYHNHLGHLLISLDHTGAPKGGFNYGPFGEILDAIGDPDEHLKRFNGKDSDKVSGLSYYGYRYYDPLSLTWSQADPFYRLIPDAAWNEPRRANLYVFTLNNALRGLDKDGLGVMDAGHGGPDLHESSKVMQQGDKHVVLNPGTVGGVTSEDWGNGGYKYYNSVSAAEQDVIAHTHLDDLTAMILAGFSGGFGGNQSRAAKAGGPNTRPLKDRGASEKRSLKKPSGRSGKQPRLKEIQKDEKAPSSVRGWIKQEINAILRGKRNNIRVPPGTELAHPPGREAAKGYNHVEAQSNVVPKEGHRARHRIDNNGKLNPDLGGAASGTID